MPSSNLIITCGFNRAEVALGLLDLLNAQYGGVEAYLKAQCQLNDGDIACIKKNLRVAPDGPIILS